LFLGIDHTAIVVWDTEASVKFYRDLLGLHVAGESENYGTEQEHLNNVFGAHLRITALLQRRRPGDRTSGVSGTARRPAISHADEQAKRPRSSADGAVEPRGRFRSPPARQLQS
jgi:catechol 2,3-dioxygenase-like lactoylglutathione lyase family enzyme